RVGHRMTNTHESPEKLAQRQCSLARVAPGLVDRVEPRNGLFEALASDEPHGVVGAAVGVAAQAIDRHDPRMLQFPGDLGFEHEPGPAPRIIGIPVLDLLQRHLAAQLLVAGQVDLTESPLGVRPKDLEPKPGSGRGPCRALTTWAYGR